MCGIQRQQKANRKETKDESGNQEENVGESLCGDKV